MKPPRKMRCLALGATLVLMSASAVLAEAAAPADSLSRADPNRRPVIRDDASPEHAIAASMVSVGGDVQLDSSDIQWTIRPVGHFRVGDHPRFMVRARNRSHQTVMLPRCGDGSEDGLRTPRMGIDVTGPEGGFFLLRGMRCGNTNGLFLSDFTETPPGGKFDPYGPGLESRVRGGQFRKPGTYSARFHYSTKEPDARRWFGQLHMS
jgi:hypothetical protein